MGKRVAAWILVFSALVIVAVIIISKSTSSHSTKHSTKDNTVYLHVSCADSGSEQITLDGSKVRVKNVHTCKNGPWGVIMLQNDTPVMAKIYGNIAVTH